MNNNKNKERPADDSEQQLNAINAMLVALEPLAYERQVQSLQVVSQCVMGSVPDVAKGERRD